MIVSSPSPPSTTSSPRPGYIRSLPAPPQMMSSSLEARTESLPAPAMITSGPRVPRIRSLPLVPMHSPTTPFTLQPLVAAVSVCTHEPTRQISSVQTFPSSHSLAFTQQLATGWNWHPACGSHVATWHESGGSGQSTAVPEEQMPSMHASLAVHSLPSSQALPSLGAWKQPASGSQASAVQSSWSSQSTSSLRHPSSGSHVTTWHASAAPLQSTSVPVQTAERHASSVVHTSPSLQAVPSALGKTAY